MIIFGLSRSWARDFGRAWERFPGNPDRQRAADLNNNFRGREIGVAIARGTRSLDRALAQASILIETMVCNRSPRLNFDFEV